jgi:hypothetical protein
MSDSVPMRHHTGVTVIVPTNLQQTYQRQAYAPIPQYRAPIAVPVPVESQLPLAEVSAPKIKINDGSVTAKTLVDSLKLPMATAKQVVAGKPYDSLNTLSEKVSDYQWSAFTEVFDFSPAS